MGVKKKFKKNDSSHALEKRTENPYPVKIKSEGESVAKMTSTESIEISKSSVMRKNPHTGAIEFFGAKSIISKSLSGDKLPIVEEKKNSLENLNNIDDADDSSDCNSEPLL